jgi:hypothetical protein
MPFGFPSETAFGFAGILTRNSRANVVGWHPRMDEAVNKRVLSTGETGEFAGENLGFGLNPRG